MNTNELLKIVAEMREWTWLPDRTPSVVMRDWADRIERLSASEATGGGPVAFVEYRLLGRARVEWLAPIPEPGTKLYATAPPPRDAGREADARDAARYRELATPEIHDFLKAVEREALHQRDRWGAEHDAGKTDADWFWLIGYLAGKAINKPEKLLHHVITTAAACLNWHAARVGAHTAMRPGIADPEAARALAGGA